MAQSRLKNQIIIDIYEDKGKMSFKSHPTGFQLMAAYLILKELVEFYFTSQEQANLALEVYSKIENMEEVPYDV